MARNLVPVTRPATRQLYPVRREGDDFTDEKFRATEQFANNDTYPNYYQGTFGANYTLPYAGGYQTGPTLWGIGQKSTFAAPLIQFRTSRPCQFMAWFSARHASTLAGWVQTVYRIDYAENGVFKGSVGGLGPLPILGGDWSVYEASPSGSFIVSTPHFGTMKANCTYDFDINFFKVINAGTIIALPGETHLKMLVW